MKNQLITLLFIITSASFSFAQTLKVNEINQGKHSTYLVKDSRLGLSVDIKNEINSHHRDSRTRQVTDFKFDKTEKADLIYNVRQVFNAKRMTDLMGERLTIDLIVFPATGKVKEVSFSLKKDTQITIAELESLEDSIKKNVVFKFQSESVANAEFAAVSLSIPFKAVLNNKFQY